MEWLSAHLFLARSADHLRVDRVLTTVVGPFAQSCLRGHSVEQYFFIRYRERGPHVRLRLQGDPTVLRERVAPALARHVAEHLAADDAGYPDEGGLESPDEQSGVSALRWIRYEPEVDRYGGGRALAIAERLFHASSEAAMELLPEVVTGGFDARLGIALAGMLALMGAAGIGPQEASEIARRHRDRWMRVKEFTGDDLIARYDVGRSLNGEALATVVRDVWWAASSEPERLPEPFPRYVERLRPLMRELRSLVDGGNVFFRGERFPTWQAAMLQLAPDYMHMANNRFGVSPHLEGYLAHLIEDVLGMEAHALPGVREAPSA